MQRWKTEEVVALFENLECEVEVTGPGGDYDTQRVLVTSPSDYTVYLSGFETSTGTEGDYHVKAADMDVEAVEVTDGRDSSGGCNGRDKDEYIFFAEVAGRITEAGFYVIDHYDQIF